MADRAANPFVGPRSFEAADRELFFGREADTRRLKSLVIARKAVLLYAPSGAGKSSLLRAGLLPCLALEVAGLRVFPVARLGGADLTSGLGNPYVRHLLAGLPGQDAPPNEEGGDDGRGLEAGLRLGLAALAVGSPDPEMEAYLLVIDQLEEIFAAANQEAECRDFLIALTGALANLPQLSLLLVLREDYLAYLDPFLHRFPDRLRARYRLELLSPEAAIRSIRGPAEHAGIEVEEGVAQKLVDSLRHGSGPAESAGNELAEFVDPVQLQVVCRRFWESLPPGTTRVEIGQVDAFGTVDDVLGAYYAEWVEAIALATGTEERALRKWIDRHLITADRLRTQVRKESDRTLGLSAAALDGLIEARLVRTEMRRGGVWYELAHDRLVGPVHADNKAWLKRRATAVADRRHRRWRAAAVALLVIAGALGVVAGLSDRLSLFAIEPPVSALALGPGGEQAALGFRDGSIRRLLGPTVPTVVIDSVCADEVASLALLPDEGWAAGCGEGTVRIERGSRRITLSGDGSTVTHLAASPDGDLLAGGTESGSIFLWSATLGRRVAGPFRGSRNSIVALTFRSHGDELLVLRTGGASVAWRRAEETPRRDP